jgi:hypothetical protein
MMIRSTCHFCFTRHPEQWLLCSCLAHSSVDLTEACNRCYFTVGEFCEGYSCRDEEHRVHWRLLHHGNCQDCWRQSVFQLEWTENTTQFKAYLEWKTIHESKGVGPKLYADIYIKILEYLNITNYKACTVCKMYKHINIHPWVDVSEGSYGTLACSECSKDAITLLEHRASEDGHLGVYNSQFPYH